MPIKPAVLQLSIYFLSILLFVAQLTGCQSNQPVIKDVVHRVTYQYDDAIRFEFSRFAEMEVYSDGTCVVNSGATTLNHTSKSVKVRIEAMRLITMQRHLHQSKELRKEFETLRTPQYEGQPYCKMVYYSQYGDRVVVKLYIDWPLRWAQEAFRQAMIEETGNPNFNEELDAGLYTKESDKFDD